MDANVDDEVRQLAYRLVREALGDGRLVRPERCDNCGGAPKTHPGIIAHHPRGYEGDAALDVEWLCPVCHGRTHCFPRGWARQWAGMDAEQRRAYSAELLARNPRLDAEWRRERSRKAGQGRRAKMTPEDMTRVAKLGGAAAAERFTAEHLAALQQKSRCECGLETNRGNIVRHCKRTGHREVSYD